MKHNMDPLLANVLGLNEEPAGDLNGERTDNEPHPVTRLFHEAEFHIAPPATVAPVRKSLTIDEVEKQLAQRRSKRRATFAAPSAEFLTSARAQIKAALLKDRDAVVASAGDLTKLFGM